MIVFRVVFACCNYSIWKSLISVPHRVHLRSLGSLSKRSIRTSKDQTLSAPTAKALLRPVLCHRRYIARLMKNHRHPCWRLSLILSLFCLPVVDPGPVGEPAAIRSHFWLHFPISLQQSVVCRSAPALPQSWHAREPWQHGGGESQSWRRRLHLRHFQRFSCWTLPF